jgi:hypothetical protein
LNKIFLVLDHKNQKNKKEAAWRSETNSFEGTFRKTTRIQFKDYVTKFS